jgi:hypothetical protein
LYIRNPYVSFVYRFPLTASLTGGGAAGFAGDAGVAAAVGVLFAELVAAAGGAVFGAFGVPGVDAGFVAGVAPVGAGVAALAEVVAAAVGSGLLAAATGGAGLLVATTGAGGADALAVSVFAGFAGAPAPVTLLPDSVATPGADTLLAGCAGTAEAAGGAAGAGAVAVSVFTGFAGAAGFSVAGSGFFSASGLAPESETLIESTWSL